MEIYFGPAKNVPSWYWVGRDVADFLRQHHEIRFFNDPSDISDGAVVFWIKCPLENSACASIKNKRLRIAFFPVDAFFGNEHIARCQEFIESCQLIVLHSRSLADFFPMNKVRFIDHYNKYGVSYDERRHNGELLWIGGFQYFPYVFRYVIENNLHRMRKINYLTDHNSPNATSAANHLGAALGLGMDFSNISSLSDFSVLEWSAAAQQKLLLSCSAAFDCKDDQDFNQVHKPPTKLQKFVCSHIPCAINNNSRLRSSLGFELCDILDAETWFSHDYQMLIVEHGRVLKRNLSLPAIANKYIAFAEEM